jgi:hypothetical protein
MFRRLPAAIGMIVATLLVPSLAGHARAATTALCPTATVAPRVVMLPIQPIRSQPVMGILCFTLQYTPSTGYLLPYEARITGLNPSLPALLRIGTALFPTSSYTSRLNVVVYVYQPFTLLQAAARCGCIGPAGPNPPHPATLFQGTQSMKILPNARGFADIGGVVALIAQH